jgi:plastocyanin
MRSRNVRRLAAAFAILAALTIAPPSAQAVVVVRGLTTTWSPAVVNIAHGGSVKWFASTGANHNLKAWGGNWSYLRNLPHGATTAARVFHHAGIFRFYCTLHGYLSGGRCYGMCGRVVVH